MAIAGQDFTVLVSPWDHHWDLFILDDVTGLVGAATVPELEDAESAARRYLAEQGLPAGGDARVRVILAPRGLAR